MNEAKELKVIITGATGMVGEGVLFECLKHPAVEQVLIVNRKPRDITHPKLRELIVPDFMKLDDVASQLAGYNACFFCAGISSAGLSEADYTHITYDVTLHFARTLLQANPEMTFIYVSGAGTDSTEKGRLMWARVKGKTENALTKIGFRREYNFRPGFMKASPGQRNLKWTYKALGWAYPIWRVVTPNLVSTMQQVGRAMINAALQGCPKQILEVPDINDVGQA
jgi:nucleoside-diphosphate-sugar epimerase